MINKIAIATVLAALISATAACNTVRGVGEDLQSVANAVDDWFDGDEVDAGDAPDAAATGGPGP